ncbi:MAG: autotransporter [Spirochaetaceae bacterium]|nr:autotransporter [Spirochaetaceae bacterium]
MKKALSVFLMIAVAFGAFADEPVADVNVAEFSGNAAVQWGVDLDSGTTGFQNSYEVNLKLNLLNNGSKSTTGDGVWGELVLKVDGDTYAQWQNKTHGDKAFAPTKGMAGETTGGSLTAFFKKVYVDVAKIHIGPAYIGIKSGDTQTGKLKMDAAIRSADDDQSVWVRNVGPAGYSQGIVAGYDSDMFKIELDLRSKPGDADYQYTDNYAAALEGEFKGVENLSIKAGASYNFAKNFQPSRAPKDKTPIGGFEYDAVTSEPEGGTPAHILGYSASAGYKLGLNDTFYIRPQVGYAGQVGFLNDEDAKLKATNISSHHMAFGLLFGWGEIGMDQNAGVYYLDDNMAKKVSPGVGVVAYIPFANTFDLTYDGKTLTKGKMYDSIAARIMPSFYSGEIVPGLTAAAYADIVIPKTGESDFSDSEAIVSYSVPEEAATPMAFAFGAKYAIEAGEVTITPQAGVRFANAAYEDYKSMGFFEEIDDGVFVGMGDQKPKEEVDEDGIISDGNYMNLKLGVDIAGLIDNTTLSVIWATDNILNDLDNDAANINKLGTLNFKAKIAL